jgi:hypothetical protein
VTKSGGQYKRHHPHRNTTTSSCIFWRLAFVVALAAWRRRLLVSWLVIATSPEKKKKKGFLYQNSPNSCKICLPSRKGDVGSSMEDDFIIASKTILYLFLFTPKYHCFDSYISINVKRDNQMTEVQIELIASLCT